jgi:hypothetical protein
MPATTPWYQGTVVPLSWVNTDTADSPQDAASIGSVSVTITLPDGTTASPSPTVTRTGVGSYTAQYPTVQAGHHVILWRSTDGTYPGAYADTFEVQSAQDGTIVSLAEAKDILHLSGTTDQDARLQGFNGSATNVVEYMCGPVVRQTVTETLPSRGLETMLSKPPVIALVPWTQVPPELAGLGITVPVPASPMIRTRVYGIEYPANQLYVDPRRGVVTNTSGLPFYYCAYVWQYTAGRPVIPHAIYDATRIILEHLWQVKRGGTSAQDVAAGESTTVLPGFGFAIPNRAIELLVSSGEASRMVAV